MFKIFALSLGLILIFTGFFYFYNPEIFEAEITETVSVYPKDISLRAFLDPAYLPESVTKEILVSVKPTWKGTLLLIICLIGIPCMLGYRLATTKTINKKSKTN
jgi:uncharacterized protein YjeT (DUF2065 family)